MNSWVGPSLITMGESETRERVVNVGSMIKIIQLNIYKLKR